MMQNLLLAAKVMTLEAYLDFELTSDVKHEFHNGKLHIMPGASYRHNTISMNIGSEIRQFIMNKELDCDTQSSDQKVFVPALNKSLYPDVTIVCDKPEYPISGRTDIVLNPNVIIEVLSPSTGNYDRGDKFFYYKTIDSFQEYVLIDQTKASVEVRFLVDKDRDLWQIKNYRRLEDMVELQSIGCEISMSKIYFRVELDPPKEIEGEEMEA